LLYYSFSQFFTVRISLGEELLSQTVPERAKFSLNCEITGHPTPHYEWYKDGVKLSNIRGKYSIKNIPWGQRLAKVIFM